MFRISQCLHAVILLILACNVTGYSSVTINDKIALDGEFRPRTEFDGHDFSDKTGFDAYTSFRTRLGLRFTNVIDDTEIYLMIGDSRLFGFNNPYLTGEPSGPNGFDNNLGVSKAYIKINNLFYGGLSIQIGRMSNDQGRSIIFGAGNWNVYGPRTYDGWKIGYKIEKSELHFWTLYGANGDRHWYPVENQPGESPDPSIDYKRDHTLTGLDASLYSGTANFLFFLDLDQEPVYDATTDGHNTALERYTAALNLKWRDDKLPCWRLDYDAAFQFGNMAYPGGKSKITAWLVAGDMAWHFNHSTKPWIGGGYHLMSGDDGEDAENTTWFYDNYSSKHKFHGYMDYFKSSTGIKSRGLRDFILRGGVSPFRNHSLNLDVHHFSVAKPFDSVVDNKNSSTLGMEMDASFLYDVRPGLKAEAGIDMFFPSEDWKGSDAKTSLFIYMTLTVKL